MRTVERTADVLVGENDRFESFPLRRHRFRRPPVNLGGGRLG